MDTLNSIFLKSQHQKFNNLPNISHKLEKKNNVWAMPELAKLFSDGVSTILYVRNKWCKSKLKQLQTLGRLQFYRVVNVSLLDFATW